MIGQNKYGALFIDFENIFYFIKNRVDGSVDSIQASIAAVSNLRVGLQDKFKLECIVQHSYADFERIGGTAQGTFYLIGIETHNVLGTDHKNAADMRLCIDALDTLYTRAEIETFVLVAGDRDYIPLVQHLRTRAKQVLVVSFKGSVSGDLLQVAEERNFIDASGFLPKEVKLRAEPNGISIAKPAAGTAPAKEPQSKRPEPQFAKVRRLDSGPQRAALDIMLTHFSEKPEIWMTPYLHKQRSLMPHLAEYERRAAISELEDRGAIVVEKRPGEQGEYSVIVINWAHPDVIALNPGR